MALLKNLFGRRAITSGLRQLGTNINGPHHATGSIMPEIRSDKITLICMRFCPYAHRTVLVLDAKKIDYDIINVALMWKPEWLWKINPIGKVPIIFHKEKIIYESLITCDYLDEEFPEIKLHSDDPATKARDRMMVELFGAKVSLPQMKLWFGFLRGQGPEDRAGHFSESMKNMKIFEKELEMRNTVFFGGDEAPGWLDYMLWPWFERVECYSTVFKGESSVEFQHNSFPHLSSWMSRMKEDSAVLPFLLDTNTHAAFVATIQTGKPNYDMMLNQ